jgi:hypothetical protein
MRNQLLLAIALVFTINAVSNAQGRTRFNPKVGITLSSLEENFDIDNWTDVSKEHNFGWNAGIDIRIEKDNGLLIIPGLHYNGWTNEIRAVEDGVPDVELSDETTIHALRAPISIGYKFIGAGEEKTFGLYARAGGTATYVAGFKEPDSDLVDLDFSKDLINDFQFSAHVGLGFDISIINIEVMYEFGLTEFYDGDISGEKNNQLVLTAGLIF